MPVPPESRPCSSSTTSRLRLGEVMGDEHADDAAADDGDLSLRREGHRVLHKPRAYEAAQHHILQQKPHYRSATIKPVLFE